MISRTPPQSSPLPPLPSTTDRPTNPVTRAYRISAELRATFFRVSESFSLGFGLCGKLRQRLSKMGGGDV